MFKLEVSPLMYYFENEDTYKYCKNLTKMSAFFDPTMEIMGLSIICIDTIKNSIIKNRAYTVEDLFDCTITYKKQNK